MDQKYKYPPLDLLRPAEKSKSDEERAGTRKVAIPAPDTDKNVCLREILESEKMRSNPSPMLAALGRNESGRPVAMDIAAMPHVLIVGDEKKGSDVSGCVNTILCSILMRASPREVRLILIDESDELSVYNGVPHLLTPFVTKPWKALTALSWARKEIDRRYERLRALRVQSIESYNDAIGHEEEKMCRILVVVEELNSLMMYDRDEAEAAICRLAQFGRAAGIHLIAASQNLQPVFIASKIKVNIPSRIVFAVSSRMDSYIILGSGGAEKLLGKGDMLYAPQGKGNLTRVQGCFVSDEEREKIISFVKNHQEAECSEDIIRNLEVADEKGGMKEPRAGEAVDEMLAKAIEIAIEAGQVSISMLHRSLRLGYLRSERLVDEMTKRGMVEEFDGSTKPRKVLITKEEWRRMQENQELNRNIAFSLKAKDKDQRIQ